MLEEATQSQARGFCVEEGEMTAHFGEASISDSSGAMSGRKGASCRGDNQHQFRLEQVLRGATCARITTPGRSGSVRCGQNARTHFLLVTLRRRRRRIIKVVRGPRPGVLQALFDAADDFV
jgi:hypothetical protein